jgi:hypothetical protein
MPASTHAARIGGASPPTLGGVKFTRWEKLDNCAKRVIRHHPRCFWIP